jgi:hypothetical protein
MWRRGWWACGLAWLGCGEPPIGRLVHEDAVVPAPPRACVVALDASGRPSWVDAHGRVETGPFGPVVDMSSSGERLVVLEALDRGVALDTFAGGVVERRRAFEHASRAWVAGEGAFVFLGGTRWLALGEEDETAILPAPEAFHRDGDALVWLGRGHPRAPDVPALVRADTTLAGASLDFPEGVPATARIASGPTYAFVADGALELRRDDMRAAAPVSSRRLVALVELDGRHVAALAEPPALVAVDFDGDAVAVELDAPPEAMVVASGHLVVVATAARLESFEVLANRIVPRRWYAAALRAPLAGPLPCLDP